MKMNLQKRSAINGAKLKNFFSNTTIYAHNPQNITFQQTHASYVFIAKPWVYKIKKPVNLGFLDYSTLEKRLYYCLREVELNSRLCPDIYEGVIPIYKSSDTLKLGMPLQTEEAPRDAVEFAVKMKYLSHDHFLSHKVQNEGISEKDINRISHKLHPFYKGQRKNASKQEDLSKWGNREHIKVNTDENFDQTESFKGDLLPAYLYNIIKDYTNSFLDIHADIFQQRIAQNCIVDGHGDLHLDHIHITDEHVCIYDCIEFNDRLRYQDWANDLAFLAMDLDYQEESRRQAQLIDEMSTLLDDKQMHDIIDFYKCYRAYVRGKVSGIQLNDNDSSKEQQNELKEKAKRYFGLAGRYAVIGSEPTALIIMGRIATGKSTISKNISQLFSIDHFSSDRTRKEIVGMDPEEASPGEFEAQMYSKEMSNNTYGQLFEKGINQLNAHHSIVLDATFSHAERRKALVDKLEEAGIQYLFIQAQSSDQLIKERLRKRDNKKSVVSDARLKHFAKLDTIFEPPDEIPDENLIKINTGDPIEETLEKLIKKMTTRRLHL